MDLMDDVAGGVMGREVSRHDRDALKAIGEGARDSGESRTDGSRCHESEG